MDATSMEMKLTREGFAVLQKDRKGDVFIHHYEGYGLQRAHKVLRQLGYRVRGREGPITLYAGDDDRVSMIFMTDSGGVLLSHFNGAFEGELEMKAFPGHRIKLHGTMAPKRNRLWFWTQVTLWLMLLAFLLGTCGLRAAEARGHRHHHHRHHVHKVSAKAIASIPEPRPVLQAQTPADPPDPPAASVRLQIDTAFNELATTDDDRYLKQALAWKVFHQLASKQEAEAKEITDRMEAYQAFATLSQEAEARDRLLDPRLLLVTGCLLAFYGFRHWRKRREPYVQDHG